MSTAPTAQARKIRPWATDRPRTLALLELILARSAVVQVERTAQSASLRAFPLVLTVQARRRVATMTATATRTTRTALSLISLRAVPLLRLMTAVPRPLRLRLLEPRARMMTARRTRIRTRMPGLPCPRVAFLQVAPLPRLTTVTLLLRPLRRQRLVAQTSPMTATRIRTRVTLPRLTTATLPRRPVAVRTSPKTATRTKTRASPLVALLPRLVVPLTPVPALPARLLRLVVVVTRARARPPVASRPAVLLLTRLPRPAATRIRTVTRTRTPTRLCPGSPPVALLHRLVVALTPVPALQALLALPVLPGLPALPALPNRLPRLHLLVVAATRVHLRLQLAVIRVLARPPVESRLAVLLPTRLPRPVATRTRTVTRIRTRIATRTRARIRTATRPRTPTRLCPASPPVARPTVVAVRLLPPRLQAAVTRTLALLAMLSRTRLAISPIRALPLEVVRTLDRRLKAASRRVVVRLRLTAFPVTRTVTSPPRRPSRTRVLARLARLAVRVAPRLATRMRATTHQFHGWTTVAQHPRRRLPRVPRVARRG